LNKTATAAENKPINLGNLGNLGNKKVARSYLKKQNIK
jgi:hypothetical protein